MYRHFQAAGYLIGPEKCASLFQENTPAPPARRLGYGKSSEWHLIARHACGFLPHGFAQPVLTEETFRFWTNLDSHLESVLR
jgi:hypothetical protein